MESTASSIAAASSAMPMNTRSRMAAMTFLLHHANAHLDSGLVLWPANPCRHDSHAVVLAHEPVLLIDDELLYRVLDDAGLAVVRHDDGRRARRTRGRRGCARRSKTPLPCLDRARRRSSRSTAGRPRTRGPCESRRCPGRNTPGTCQPNRPASPRPGDGRYAR